MDPAAGSLLALSETAAALAAVEEPEVDDDRSSSLSELEEDEPEDPAEDNTPAPMLLDGDSEAETERLEESPDKILRRKTTGNTPSKLAQTLNVDERPEIESLTESGISSPISSHADSEELSEAEDNEEEQLNIQLGAVSPTKRKREENEEEDDEEMARTRRRRTGSLEASDEEKSDIESEAEERSQVSRGNTPEPMEIEAVDDEVEDEDEEPAEIDKIDSNEEDTKPHKKTVPTRSSKRKGKSELLTDADQEVDDDAEAAEESDEVEADDAEAVAKSEEEQAKRMAAMEALTALERHFATLRDRLYDERIAAINQELVQLAESKPSHPELVRQVEVVNKYRDDKFEVEQKLLVYKIGALKNKSVAERSQIHSQYWQTVRDVREKHLERLSEHFYRIQRDRFKSDTPVPSYIIPFTEKRSKQITQQTSYNKEVSILSGVAKYIGFPSAPNLTQPQSKELEDDLQKMGISSQIRTTRQVPRMASAFSSSLTAPTAEEQFLEKNPWANAQHPLHRLGMSRQNSNRSPLNESYLTPAQQRGGTETAGVVGSASTIAEHPSAQVSSVLNTPHDMLSSQTKIEATNLVNLQNHHHHLESPLDTRHPNPTSEPMQVDHEGPPPQDQEPYTSPLAARAATATSPAQASLSLVDNIPTHSTASQYHTQPPGITAGSGLGGAGRYSLV